MNRRLPILSRLIPRSPSPLVLLLFLSAFAWVPLLASGYFLRAHDAAHNLFWLVQFDHAIQDGFLWPRWAADHALGYGYPLWIFYAPLSFYAAEIVHLLGFSIVTSVKMVWGLAFILSGITMYRFTSRLWGRGPGLIAGLLYIYAPYHLVNIYVRAALAEFVAMALFPWVLHAYWELLNEPNRRRLAIAALALGLTLLTHSVTVVIFPPLLALLILYWLVVRWRRGRTIPWREGLTILGAGLLGVAVAMIFLLPVLAERRHIVQDQWVANSYNFADQFLYPFQLFDQSWGFGHALAGPDDGMSLQIGLWLLILGLASLPFLFSAPRRRPELLIGFVATGLIALLMTLPLSRFLWQGMPFVALIQFPFRMLAPVVLCLSLAAGGVVASLAPEPAPGLGKGRHIPFSPLLLALSLAIVFTSYRYTLPQHTAVTERDQSSLAVIDFEMAYPDMRGQTAYATSPPTDTPKRPAYEAGETLPLATIIAGEGVVETVRHGAGSEQVLVRAESPVTVQFFTFWYPGWRAVSNGKSLPTRAEGPSGLITLDLPAGEHDVTIRFTNTPLRLVATLISLVAVLIIFALLFWRWKPRRQ